MELSATFEINIDELMIDCLASMIDEIGYRNKAGLIEIISEATRHDCPVAIVEHLPKDLLTEVLKFLSFQKVCNKFILKFLTFYAHMDNFLNQWLIQSF